MKTLLSTLFLVTVCSLAAQSFSPERERQEQKIADEIMAVEKQRVAAMLAQDPEAMGRILSDKYVQVTSFGEIRNKSHIVNGLRNKTIKYDAIQNSDHRVVVDGHTAVITGFAERKGRDRDRDLSGSFRFIRTWVKQEDGSWKLLAQQSTSVERRR